jgi:hypothetical protein
MIDDARQASRLSGQQFQRGGRGERSLHAGLTDLMHHVGRSFGFDEPSQVKAESDTLIDGLKHFQS